MNHCDLPGNEYTYIYNIIVRLAVAHDFVHVKFKNVVYVTQQ